jgi:tellurite resistance protein TehA-like permease
MSATWLLPVVTLIVASSTGGVLSNSLGDHNVEQALDTLTVSVFMVTVGFSLALMILVIYLQRLITCGIPSERNILSIFIPLGPTGQAGYSILLIGEGFRLLLPRAAKANSYFLSANPTPIVIDICCICISFMLWSLATMWMIYGFLSLYTGLRQSYIPFRVTSWGLVFPNVCPHRMKRKVLIHDLQGVYATHTIQLGQRFDSEGLRIWGALWAGGTLILWISLFCRSMLEMKALFTMREAYSDSFHLKGGYAEERAPVTTTNMSRHNLEP